jgi:hypothetical protein
MATRGQEEILEVAGKTIEKVVKYLDTDGDVCWLEVHFGDGTFIEVHGRTFANGTTRLDVELQS